MLVTVCYLACRVYPLLHPAASAAATSLLPGAPRAASSHLLALVLVVLVVLVLVLVLLVLLLMLMLLLLLLSMMRLTLTVTLSRRCGRWSGRRLRARRDSAAHVLPDARVCGWCVCRPALGRVWRTRVPGCAPPGHPRHHRRAGQCA